jgi:tight adherence protein C
MIFAAFTFVVVFLLIASGGLLLFYREAMLQRITEVVTPHEKEGAFLSSIRHTGSSFSELIGHLERLLPRSQAEVSVVQQRLIRAGYRNDSAVDLFYSAKVLVPALLCLIVLVTGIAHDNPVLGYVIAAGMGFLLPDMWLGRRIKARQSRIRLGLPDVLDLLVVCIEAGLSLDQATVRTTEELRTAHPAICDELGIVVLEQRAGRPRSDAWKQLADRTDVDSVRNLVSVLVQSEQLGTSVAKTLRVHSDALRTQRRQKVEEQAAKTTIKLVFPLVFFIFPSLFVVTLGPALISMSESFQQYLTH